VIKSPTTTSSRHFLLETATHDFNRYPRPLLLRRNYALSTTRHRIRTKRNIEKGQCLTGQVMAPEVEDLEALIGRIPACCSTTTPELRCCCGRTDCAYLKHNCVALDDLEKEVRTAAQLGQVCIPHPSTFRFPRLHDSNRPFPGLVRVVMSNFLCRVLLPWRKQRA
jgi:hypothetical protein